MMDTLIGSQSIIITFDVDAFLFEKLNEINEIGLKVVEVNCVDEKLLKKIINQFPSLKIGAGNIINTHQLETCYKAGAHFVTSPGVLPSIIQTANIYSINYFPGVATASEALQALDSGCHHVRPYPASFNFCDLLNKYFPLLRLFPAEVQWNEAEHYLDLPSVAGVSILNPEKEILESLAKGVLV